MMTRPHFSEKTCNRKRPAVAGLCLLEGFHTGAANPDKKDFKEESSFNTRFLLSIIMSALVLFASLVYNEKNKERWTL